MAKVEVSFGGVEVVKEFRTVSDILNDSNTLNYLGADASQVDARIDGQIVDGSTHLSEGDVVELVQKSCKKG